MIREMIHTANIGDYVVYKNVALTESNGYIKSISMGGIEVNSNYGNTFVKWENVINIDKTKKVVWI
jgi:hypothetical protein